ncbi:MAG: hypothetical protein C0397_13515 [Odoribacter sp.]|nr:hypothetical protein [Odoribacter sp.]
MNTAGRIFNFRNKSRISIPKKDIWFYSDGSTIPESPVSENNSTRNDRLSILDDDYNRYSLENSGRSRNKKESPFVVDWQMSDEF